MLLMVWDDPKTIAAPIRAEVPTNHSVGSSKMEKIAVTETNGITTLSKSLREFCVCGSISRRLLMRLRDLLKIL